MNRLNRMLALLLAALMLCGMMSAVAEVEVALDAPVDVEGIEVESVQDELEAPLELGDELALTEDLQLVETAPEAANEAVEAEAQPNPASEDDPFNINDAGVLVKYTGSDRDVIIPEKVTAIGRGSFRDNARLTSVTIPASVTSIQTNAFNGCDRLSSVYVLAEDITIASNSFEGTQPVFYTVSGSSAAAWAQKKGFEVEDNLVALKASTRMEAAIGDTLRIFVYGDSVLNYTSSNNSVATVSSKGVITVQNGGTAQITVVTESRRVLSLVLTVAYPQARLSARKMSLKVGNSKTLSVSNLSGRTVTWTSGNVNVASVRGGRVTAVGIGSCTVTASLSDGTTLTCKVTVKDNAKLSRTRLTVRAGHSHALRVSGANGRRVTWTSSDNSVASVQNGRVTGHKAGKCTVTAQIQNGKTLKCKVTVTDNAKLNKTSISLKIGGYYTLKVRHAGNRAVTWSSSNTGIASVHGGRVTAHKAGTCTITAKLAGGKTLTCKVTVTDPVKLSKTKLTLKEGETFKLTISGQGQNIAAWSSSDVRIATVDNFGMVTAVKAGKCFINVRLSNGTQLQCKLTVKAKK